MYGKHVWMKIILFMYPKKETTRDAGFVGRGSNFLIRMADMIEKVMSF